MVSQIHQVEKSATDRDGKPVEPSPSMTASEAVIEVLKVSDESLHLQGVQDSALAYLIARCSKALSRPLLIITSTEREAEKYVESLGFFLGEERTRADQRLLQKIRHFPSRMAHREQSLRKIEATTSRIEALYALQFAPEPVMVVTSAPALLEKLMPPEVLSENVEYRVKGEELEMEALCRRLVERGYYPVPVVEEYGDMSRRGGVLDIYVPLYRWPVRLEFFGDELESIRLFHPGTQRSLAVLEDVLLLPSSEVIFNAESCKHAQDAVYRDVRSGALSPAVGAAWLEKIREGQSIGQLDLILPAFYDHSCCLLDYLHPSTIVFSADTGRNRSEMEEFYGRQLLLDSEARSSGDWFLPALERYEEPEKILGRLEKFQQVSVNALADPSRRRRVFDLATEDNSRLSLTIRSHPGRERLLDPLARKLQEWQGQGFHTFLICRQREQALRLVDLLKHYQVDAVFTGLPFGEESYESRTVKVMVGPSLKGFVWPGEAMAVVSEEEIMGRASRRASKKDISGIFLNSFQDLHAGDFVVHVDHGIGVYKELVHLEVGGTESDFLLIAYQGNDRLYVPVHKLRSVQKYLGVDGYEPQVDKLGGKSWDAVKKKARESVERIAKELLGLYAQRQVREGFRFSPPDQYFHEFETTFAFEETPDQISAIEDVLRDMSASRPMDRLICGDVGYGKTEVAIRAAFKAVTDGKQVAMLVPTTVLAEQHYQTFRERFEGFPVEVAALSRFKTGAQQKQVIKGLREGRIDVVVGTHRLLQEDVVFRDLGLVIVDEEHRFGVKHKEALKQLRVSVDVLALSATPIPRTLHMALSGIRDLSTIETPPQDRRAIETCVSKYDDLTIKEAVYRELQRGGQVFFVHNHVHSIYHMAARLRELIPEARIAVAHGQMKERELEKVMLDFIQRRVDVLVCTTIIESGLDIPVANTIIINRADKFGLAQIYQLRGRVGRSSEQAYAYLLVPGEHLITRDAQRRLRALMDFSELGAGFKIALNDLQIRGGGTILGSAQSGHIAAVGYELYLELLENAVRELKGERLERETLDPEINVKLSAFLPQGFIPDPDQRLLAYKRLATIMDEAGVQDLAKEWRDRYGPFPESVRNLLVLAGIRVQAKRWGISRLDANGDDFTLLFVEPSELLSLSALLERERCSFSIETEHKLRVEIWGRDEAQRLARLKRILQERRERDTDIKSIQ